MKVVDGHKFEEKEKEQIADLIYDSFVQKFGVIKNDKTKTCNILIKCLKYEMGLYLMNEDSDIVGVIGTVTNRKSFYKIHLKYFREEYALIKALVMYFLFIIETRINVKDDEVYIVALAIKKDYRGKGFAGKLMDEIFSKYSMENTKKVVLTVISNNDDAIHLYKKKGFKITNERYYGGITKKAGFTSVLRMEKML